MRDVLLLTNIVKDKTSNIHCFRLVYWPVIYNSIAATHSKEILIPKPLKNSV
jgi:hypothetical protein